MLFKPSPKTTALARRGNWMFLPFWACSLTYILLRGSNSIPTSWDATFFVLFGIFFVVNVYHGVAFLVSARSDAKRSQHFDPDVAALVDGEIDIPEYRRRKEATSEDAQEAAGDQATTQSEQSNSAAARDG